MIMNIPIKQYKPQNMNKFYLNLKQVLSICDKHGDQQWYLFYLIPYMAESFLSAVLSYIIQCINLSTYCMKMYKYGAVY